MSMLFNPIIKKVKRHFYSINKRKVLHNNNGPAVEHADGTKEWALDGVKMSKDHWSQRRQKIPGERPDRVDRSKPEKPQNN